MVYDTSSCGCSGGSKPLQIITPTTTTDFEYSESTGKLVEIQGKRLGVSGEQEDTLRFTYDGSLPLSVEWSGSVNGRVDVSYNNDFKVVSQSVNNTNTVGFSYDDDGLLTQAGDLSISYNSQNGMLTGTSLGNVLTDYSYNAYGELAEYSAQYNSTDLFSTEYSLDNIGRITQIIEHVLGDSDTLNYTYDLSGRLEHVFRNDTLISSYGYDSNGNRLFHATQSDTLFGNYDDQDRMLSYGNSTYNYNARGSLTFKAENGDTTFYTYDLMGNLTNVTLPNGDLIEYLIDSQNRRVGKKLNGVIQKQWIYQDQLNPIAEFDGNGNLIARFVYGDKGHVPAYMVKNDSTYRFITDHLGSVLFVVNSETGFIAQQISYDEFGNVRSNTNPDFQPFAYAGGLYDTETELIRFGFRDYDATTGRWTAKDPIGFESEQLNLYTYCSNEPVNYIDPTGKFGWVGAAVGAVIGGVSGYMATGTLGGTLAGAAIGGASGFLGQFGASWYAGAAIGVATGGGSNLLWQLLVEGVDLDCIDWSDVGKSALLGGATGALSGARASGREIKIGKNVRVNPTGQDKGPWQSKLPHYHRRITDPSGNTVPGGGIGWHRPWQRGF